MTEPVQPEIEVVTLDTGLTAATIERDMIVVDEVPSIQVVTVGEPGPPGAQGIPGSGSAAESYVTAAAIGGNRVVVTNASGLLEYATNTNTAHANQAVRLTTQAGALGDTITVLVSGRMTEPSWAWTPGGALYVGTNGLMTQTPPVSPAVFSKIIAVAETATRVLMLHEPPVMLV